MGMPRVQWVNVYDLQPGDEITITKDESTGPRDLDGYYCGIRDGGLVLFLYERGQLSKHYLVPRAEHLGALGTLGAHLKLRRRTSEARIDTGHA